MKIALTVLTISVAIVAQLLFIGVKDAPFGVRLLFAVAFLAAITSAAAVVLIAIWSRAARSSPPPSSESRCAI